MIIPIQRFWNGYRAFRLLGTGLLLVSEVAKKCQLWTTDAIIDTLLMQLS